MKEEKTIFNILSCHCINSMRKSKKTMVNVICNEMNIFTCGVANNKNSSAALKESWLSYLQKLNNATKFISFVIFIRIT